MENNILLVFLNFIIFSIEIVAILYISLKIQRQIEDLKKETEQNSVALKAQANFNHLINSAILQVHSAIKSIKEDVENINNNYDDLVKENNKFKIN